MLGVELFDLSADFDPKSDPVVRMAMRLLRDRLQQYYSNEGATDSNVISLEPGSYVPRFGRRNDREQPRVPIAVLLLATSTGDAGDAESAGLVGKRFSLDWPRTPLFVWSRTNGRRLSESWT